MQFSIRKLETDKADRTVDGYNSKGFRNMLESHMENIKNHKDTTSLLIEGNRYITFKGDLAGWLLTKNIGPNYHWVIARMNGFTDATDYDGILRTFQVPSKSYIDELLQMHRTSMAAG